MFIKSIILENFKNIDSGLKTHRLSIDFSKQTNPICIIAGGNGRGKTSLMSYLSPFATLGSFDVRDTNQLILKGKNGYKKITLVDDEKNIYEIEHFYTPTKDSVSIKSYFKRNGQELNANGNVTSFKKLVSEFLDIEIDYLKLIRIGDNVQNLIRSRASERKVFMGKILDDVAIYLKQYKMIVQEERDLKVVISHMMDSLQKLNIESIDSVKEELQQLKKKIKDVGTTVEELEKQRTTLLSKIGELQYDGNSKERIRELEKKLKDFEKLSNDIDLSKTSVSKLKEEEERASRNFIEASTTFRWLEKLYNSKIENLDTELSNLEKIEIALEKEEKDLNLQSLEDHLVELKKTKHHLYQTAFEEMQLNITKEEFEDFMVFLKNIQTVLNMTYEFGKEPIREVLNGMRDAIDIPNFITSSLVLLESKERKERMSIIDRLIKKYSMDVSCKEACPYKQLHAELMAIRDAKPVDKVTHDAEFYQMMKLAYENLRNVVEQMKEKKEEIQKMPSEIQEWFSIDTLFGNIEKGEKIYKDTVLHKYLSFFAEKASFEKVSEEVSALEQDISRLRNLSKVPFLKEERKQLKERISTIKEDIEETKEEMDAAMQQREQYDAETIELQTKIEVLTYYESWNKELEELTNREIEYTLLMERLSELDASLREEKEKEKLFREHCLLREQNLIRYKALLQDIEEKEKVAQDYYYLKIALSNREGIPLEFISYFLEDTRDIANEILDIVFDGSLRLRKFKIAEDCFDMPYEKDGKVIEDVSLSSQGEQSYFNMAISSALRCQRLNRYNIALYDEVDSTFDDNKRQRFIPAMERQIELNHIEQAFLITHNLMYHQYPVDVIDLDHPEKSTIDVTLG